MPDERAQELRLFVACELPDDVRSALADVQSHLRRLGGDGLRWVRPEGIHVTLKFLGGVPEPKVPGITSALAAAIEPFELRLQPATLGTFGGTGLRVVWAGLEGDTRALAALAGGVDQALATLGFRHERRPFAAHLTLARAPDRLSLADRRRLAGLLEGQVLPAIPPMVLTEVCLMRSILGPAGAVYQCLAAFPKPAS